MDQKRGSSGGVSEEKSTSPPAAGSQSKTPTTAAPPPPAAASTSSTSNAAHGKDTAGITAEASASAVGNSSSTGAAAGAESDGRSQGKAREEHHDEEEEEEEEIVIEQPLLTIKEVFVYKVPTLRASSGHRAEEWGLANPVFSGILKMVQLGNACCLRLFKPPPEEELGGTPELFAECEVRLDKGRTVQAYVESVIDSSRYFVLRCEDKASGKHAYVGIGFRERTSAFDLKAVLDDFVRFLDRQKRAAESSAVARTEAGGEEGDPGPAPQMKDLSIADGEKVHIGFKVASNGSSRTRRRPRSDASTAGGLGLGLLAPPPLPGTTYKGSALADSPPPISPPPNATSPRNGTSPPTGTSPQNGTSPPTGTSPSAVEPPDAISPSTVPPDAEVDAQGTRASLSGRLGAEGSKEGVAEGSGEGGVAANGEGAGGGDGGDDDDDDGWGEFESA